MSLKYELCNKSKLPIKTIKELIVNYERILDSVIEVLKIDKNYIFSVIFTNDARIHKINKEYRGIDRTTDVITFALLDNADEYEFLMDEIELGDIFINVDAIYRQALEFGHSDIREASFLFTHGILHLFGYDHMKKEDEEVMFKLQDQILDPIIKRGE